jgi:hypothetical protein
VKFAFVPLLSPLIQPEKIQHLNPWVVIWPPRYDKSERSTLIVTGRTL